jgi:ubiquinone/menaquinone biosynthesis C-methylase UbiE
VSFDTRPVRHAYQMIVNEYADKFSGELATNAFDRSVLDETLSSLRAGALVLDLGCGPGQIAAYLDSPGMRVIGLDLTPAMLDLARTDHPGIPFVDGDVFALPLRPHSLDGIVAWYSLHNMPRTELPSALREIRRALHPEGALLIATHGGNGGEVVRTEWLGRQERVFITYYQPEVLKSVLVEFGFQVSALWRRPPLEHERQTTKLYVTAWQGKG